MHSCKICTLSKERNPVAKYCYRKERLYLAIESKLFRTHLANIDKSKEGSYLATHLPNITKRENGKYITTHFKNIAYDREGSLLAPKGSYLATQLINITKHENGKYIATYFTNIAKRKNSMVYSSPIIKYYETRKWQVYL